MTITRRQLTRTPETETAYAQRAAQILKTFQDETGQDWVDDPLALADWFRFKATRLRKSTFRLYRVALCRYMAKNGPHELVTALKDIPMNIVGIHVGPHVTSASKLKYVPLDLFHVIIKDLENSNSAYADLLVCWITCNSMLGLRPSEWKSAKLSGTVLSCDNAKFSNGRGRFGKRKLDISGLHPYFIDCTNKMLKDIQFFINQGISFEKIYASCRQLLYRTQYKLFPNKKQNITLYSTRHQFIANAKYKGATSEEIAIMAGHTSLETAVYHYANKKYGRSFFMYETIKEIPTLPIGYDNTNHLTIENVFEEVPHS